MGEAVGTPSAATETPQQSPQAAESSIADVASPAAAHSPGNDAPPLVQGGGESDAGSPSGEASPAAAIDAGAGPLEADGSVAGASAAESSPKAPGSATQASPTPPTVELSVRRTKAGQCC